MYKNPFIVNITILVLLILAGFGCENKTKEIEKPKIVSKKISLDSDPSLENKAIEANIPISLDKNDDAAQIKMVESTIESNESMLQHANFDIEPNSPDTQDSLEETNLPEPEEVSSNGPSDELELISENDETNESDSLNSFNDTVTDRDEEEKRKAADLLASIHHEANKSAQNENDSLDSLSNPFLPLFSDAPAIPKDKKQGRKPPKPERERTPLEKVDLSQLKLVATLRAVSGNKALVEDSTGKGYVVNKGTYIGINSGSVVEITNQSVVVEEEIETLSGDIKIQRREIKLQKAPGE